jgi:hypothetical protein
MAATQEPAPFSRKMQVNRTGGGYFSMPEKVFAKVCASPGHRAET